MKEICYPNFCDFIAEIEIEGKIITLWRYSKRKYYLCIEGQKEALEFNSRKAVDAFLTNM